MQAVLNFLMANKAALLGAAFLLSELLAYLPNVKSNSVFQAIVNGLKSVGADKNVPPAL